MVLAAENMGEKSSLNTARLYCVRRNPSRLCRRHSDTRPRDDDIEKHDDVVVTCKVAQKEAGPAGCMYYTAKAPLLICHSETLLPCASVSPTVSRKAPAGAPSITR